MLKDHLQIYTLSIVFLGQFNPVIIQPFWLANKKLIREKEAENADIELIHNELVRYKMDWARIEITKERFEIETSQEPYFDPIKDLITSIFDILNETPIKAVGINHIFHFDITNEELFYEFGNTLAPLNNWDNFLDNPKLLNLEIVEQKRKDGLNGYYRIRVNPSDQLNRKQGVSININDHFGIEKNKEGRNGEILGLLNDNWQKSSERANDSIEEIWKQINK